METARFLKAQKPRVSACLTWYKNELQEIYFHLGCCSCLEAHPNLHQVKIGMARKFQEMNKYFLTALISKFITSWSSGFEKFLRFINSAYKKFNKHFGTSWTRLKIIVGQFFSSVERIFKVCV